MYMYSLQLKVDGSLLSTCFLSQIDAKTLEIKNDLNLVFTTF